VVTLTIRPGVKFHNGEEVTAEDIKFSIETWQRPQASVSVSGPAIRGTVKSVEVLDRYQAQVPLASPNAIFATLQVGWAIVVESALSFLGAGIPPPEPTWGNLVAEGRDVLDTAWWISVFPALAITLAVLSFNLFGDWLRDVLDPKLRQL
jgi:ABC-type transport system substrate-binding protein